MPGEIDPKVVSAAMSAGMANDSCAFKDAVHQLADPWDRVALLHELGRLGASDNHDKPADRTLGFGISTAVAWGSSALAQVGGRAGMLYELKILGDSVTENTPGCKKNEPLVSELPKHAGDGLV